MATSGTYAWSLPGDDLLTEAWERIGKNPALLNGDVARSARVSLQLLQIAWTNRGLNLWQVERQQATLAVGTGTLVLDAATADVLDLACAWQGEELPVLPIGRAEFQALPQKSLRGRPTQVWCERLRDAPVLHLYPVPDRAYVLSWYRIRQPQDFSALGQTADAPVLFAEALASGLAWKLAEKYAPERLAEKQALYGAALADATGENRERVPLRIMPQFRT